MFRNIHYIYPDKFFLWMDFRYSSVKADFHSTSFWLVVWRVDYNKLTKNQTNVLQVIVVSLIYALQCRRVVTLPLARCTRESCAVSIDLDRTFQSWESIPKWKWRKCSFWDGKPILLPIKISLKVARKFSNFLTSIPALSYGRPHMIVFSSEI